MKEERILCLGGSGVRFPAYIGAVGVLEDKYKFTEFIAISGGAITAAFFACGFSVAETLNTVNQLDFRSFLKRNYLWPIYGDHRYKSQPIIDCLDKLYGGLKLGETKYPLSVITYDLNSQQEVVFSSETTPDISVAFAVKCSMCIPFVFESSVWNGFKCLIDGGISNNIGVDLTKGKNKKFIGIKTTGNIQETLYTGKWFNTIRNADMLISSLMDALDKEHMDDVDSGDNMLFIPCAESSLNFDIKPEEKASLFSRGVKAARKFLERKGVDETKTE